MLFRRSLIIGLIFIEAGCVYRSVFDLPFMYTAREVAPALPDVTSSDSRAALSGHFFMPTEPGISVLPAPEIELNPAVQRELKLLQGRERRFISAGMLNRRRYDSALKEIFRDEGVPEALLHVALIESKFQPKVKSRAGAVGMWQFMKGTARAYGLRIGVFEDQRKDPILSSIAAARHLRDLYNKYQDWWLALAAYNSGSGRVDRAIKKGRTRDFWSLSARRLLPGQTRRYVPRFIAVHYIVQSPVINGFTRAEISGLRVG